MGHVFADITLRNVGDVTNVRRGLIEEPEIRQTAVTAMVDTGAVTLVIDEALRQQLGLELASPYEGLLADGSKHNYAKTEAVEVQWKERSAICQAVVVPNASIVLLGVIPLEAMDLVINPVKQELTGAHGDKMLVFV